MIKPVKEQIYFSPAKFGIGSLKSEGFLHQLKKNFAIVGNMARLSKVIRHHEDKGEARRAAYLRTVYISKLQELKASENFLARYNLLGL